MPANRRQQNSQLPAASMTAKTVPKYPNKDSPKPTAISNLSTNHESATLPATAQANNHLNGQVSTGSKVNGTPAVNRKKQKRREKEAAKRAAAGQAENTRMGDVSASGVVQKQIHDLEARFREHRIDDQYSPEQQLDPVDDEPYYSEEAYSGSFGVNGSPQTGYTIPSTNTSAKKSKKKKKSKNSQSRGAEKPQGNGSTHGHMGLPVSPLERTSLPRGQGISKEKIWNTSSQEERERIKEFWLSLSEDERKSLVKVEKDAVLKKMKEQQKHSCSCTVCGRKRTAIEEELEVLYDAYYEELEQYANHQVDVGNSIIPPPRRFAPLNGLQPPNLLPPSFSSQQQSRGRIMEQLGDDDYDEGEVDGDEEYSQDEGDDEDDEDYSDEEPEELPRSHAADFFNFGNSLTVQGGILTVADDLLKNDGKKFIEMMEQLAERRMAREEDAREQFSNTNYGQPFNATMPPHSHQHSHPLPPEGEDCDDEEEEEEEEEYDSQDEDYDEEEMDTMTEEQRMEEGRRMFQIFAARMFEQRVLTAYKKKVSEERTQRLLEELEEENKAKSEKQAKKARDAQKRKEKLAQKKQALAEEKARREAEEAEKLATLRLAEEKKAEEARIRAEEKRKKKEAQKRAEEEERQRKEAEKARRLQEQRERQVEQERKQREAKEKERREKDEQRQKEREAKEVKDRETKERRDKQERERSESLAKEEACKLAKEKQKCEELTYQKDAPQTTPNNVVSSKRIPIPIPANLQPHPVASPHVPIAIPAFQKAPTPIKLRTSSIQHDSDPSAPHTPQNGIPSRDSPPALPSSVPQSPSHIGLSNKSQTQYPFLHQPQVTSPMHSALKNSPSLPPQSNMYGNIQSMGGMPYPPGIPIMAPYFGRIPHEPMYSPHQGVGAQFRPLIGPNSVQISMNMHQIPQGRGFPIQHGPPGFTQGIQNTHGGIARGFGTQKDHPGSQPHSRQQSGSLDPPVPTAHPIARPAPIGRPASVVNGQNHRDMKSDIDDFRNHLGSSALLDDSDEPLHSGTTARRSSAALSQNFVPPFGMGQSTFSSPITSYGSWGGTPNLFGQSSLPDPGLVGAWPSSGFMAGAQNTRPAHSRPVGVRLMICRACKNLEGVSTDGFNAISVIKEQVEQMNPPGEQPVSDKEILDICETEGNAINGGGSFDIREEGNGFWSIRYENEIPPHRPLGAPGEIGSPILGNSGVPRIPTSHPQHWY